MSVELDHVFVFCAANAPEASVLRAQGLLEGSSNTHPGQGTANRRFFFSNAFLELLWVSNPAEAQSEAVLPTQLWDRWQRRTSGVCPIGLVFRPRSDSTVRPPFPSWSYKPSYLPAGLSIEVGSGIKPTEPLLFYLPFVRPRNRSHTEPTTHPARIREVAAIGLGMPDPSNLSEGVKCLVGTGLIRVRKAPDYLLELMFFGDGTTTIDLRPHLPVVFVPLGSGT